ncbi:hypothetical protein B9Q03_08345 [Candidatus Marsarchaeota G2 archaeon OSP_D]|uniref:Bacterial repeat domain-containing protein n=2 Tax=Candidatus Marsarchaeota group 2 TaxID=2203771 RepID=A0A2R6CBV8_9ARCH|nr:MAG: hypothetical protein B9Q03_08345 [Candidatus Marsarchaeota G2 archaeon OSP_D]PSO08236.1 MAG: hypothetical protein B9Q04_06625 [Candidatus Marsarchaeota G2 archaeon BE_D]
MRTKILLIALLASACLLTQSSAFPGGVVSLHMLPALGVAAAASGTTVTLTLTPAAGSNPVSQTNYFTVTYTNSSGASSTAKYTGSPLTLQIQPGSTVSISPTSSSSTPTEMWCLATTSTGTCTTTTFTPPSTATTYSATYYYYDLLGFKVEYSVVGGGSGYGAPQLSYTTAPSTPSSTNQQVTETLTLATTQTSIWAVRGSQIVVSKTLPGSGSTQRWATNITTWTVGVTQPPPSNITYYNQYLASVNPSLSSGSFAYNNLATLLFTEYGGPATATLSGPSTIWVDAGGFLGWLASTTGSNFNTQYSATPFTYGLVGYWQLAEGFGSTVYDLSGEGNNGHTVNSPVWVQSSSCLLGVCLSLNGLNQYVVAGSNAIPVGSAGFTKVVWVYLPNGLNSQEENREILCWGGTSYAGAQNCLLTGSSPNQLVNTFGGGASLTWTSTHLVAGWNMVAVTYNGSVEDAYVNGVLEASIKPPTPYVQSSPVYIGGGFPGYGYFDHPIQDVRVYTYAWSQAQVSEYYSMNRVHLEYTVTYPDESFSVKYYEQYRESVFYSVVGGGSPTPPSISFYSFGQTFSQTLSLTPQTIWMDAGTLFSVTNPIPSTSGDERWATNQTSFLTPLTNRIHIYYFNQYLFNVAYQVVGGGSGYGYPGFNYTSLGRQQSTVLQTTSSQVWLDNSTKWYVSLELPGSGSTQRWMGDFQSSGTVKAPANLSFTYYHQFNLVFTFNVKGGGSGYSAPTISYTTFGVNTTTQSGVSVWADAYTTYVYTNPLEGSTTQERWYTPTPSGDVVTPGVVAVVYFHQFLLSVSYTVIGGGTPPTPVLNATTFGTPTSYSVEPTGTAVWVDNGGSYAAQRTLEYANQTNVRWISLTPTNGTVTSPLNLRLVYYHQFYVEVTANTQLGGEVSPQSGWYNATSTITLSATPTQGWVFERWSGTGGASYTGNQSTTTLSLNSPIVEEAVFYPGLNITVETGGSVTYSYQGGSGSLGGGSTHILYVPPGTIVTLIEKPTPILFVAQGFTYTSGTLSYNTTITVNQPLGVKAVFTPNYPAIIVILLAAAAVIVLVLAASRRHSQTPTS